MGGSRIWDAQERPQGVRWVPPSGSGARKSIGEFHPFHLLPMSHPNAHDLKPRETRLLLRKLRDVNLGAQRVAIRSGLSVAFAGCLTLDAPVEQGVRYRLRSADGESQTLTLEARGVDLEIRLRTADGERTLVAPLTMDAQGRTSSPTIAARMDVDEGTRRDCEHFLRRVVRGVFAA